MTNHPLHSKLRILAADDEDVILKLYRDMIVPEKNPFSFDGISSEINIPPSLTFELVTCRQGTEAIKAVQKSLEDDQPFAIAFLDVRMPPGLDGIQTGKQIRKIDPHIEIVIITAFTDYSPEEIGQCIPPADKLFYLHKPFAVYEIQQFAMSLGTKWLMYRQLRKHHEELERTVAERTAELARVNEELKKDIARRKQVEADLRDSREIFYSFMRHQPALAYIKDQNGRYVYFNEAYNKVMKGNPSDRIGKTDNELWSSELAAQIKAVDAKVMTSGNVIKTMEKVKSGNETQTFYISKFPILRDGKPFLLGGIALDITDRIRAEQSLRELNEALEQRVTERTLKLEEANLSLEEALKHVRQLAQEADAANRAKGEFLANMSHEIRTPMSGIVGMCDLIIRTELNPRQKEYVNIICSSARALVGLINDILDFSKIEAGKLDFENIPFSLNELIEDVVSLFLERITEKGILLDVDIASDVPEYLIADPLRLRQILINLISNAVKFTDKGIIGVSIQTMPRSRPVPEEGIKVAADAGDTVELRFCVQDTGIGIDPAFQGRLFDIFSQANGATTRKYGGTGLGLAICKRIINMMGGDIWVESTPGGGSSFYFTVTLKTVPPEDFDISDDKSVLKKTSGKLTVDETGSSDLSDLHVLVVEDHPVNRMVAVELLKTAKISVDTANNGLEAINALANKRYDAVFMDVQMPQMDGIQATHIIRKKMKLNDLPIISITAHAMSGDREKCLEAGMNDYISKPINHRELFAALKKNIPRLKPQSYPPIKKVKTTAAAPAPVKKKPDDRLPDALPGLNIREGIARLAGARDLYIDLVTFFCEEKKGFICEFLECINNKDFEAATIKAHSLKGAAGTISAVELSKAARSLEEACKAEDETLMRDALKCVEDRLAQVVVSSENISTILRPENDAAKIVDNNPQSTGTLADIIQEMDDNLQHADPVESETCMNKLKACLAHASFESELTELAQQLFKLVGEYNYDDARKILNALKNKSLI